MSEMHEGEFRHELGFALLQHLRANDMVIALSDLDGTALSGFNETEDAATEALGDRVKAIVEALTEGWSVDKTMLDLDADGILRDPAAPLRHQGDDYDTSKATKAIVFEVSTAHRPLNTEEQAAFDEREARWKAKSAREQAVRAWRHSGDIDTPPPDGIGIDDLFDQVIWWLTKDKRAMRIGEMTPSHRLNLLRLMERQAKTWRDAEFMSFLAMGGPDEVWSAAENMPPQEWLNDKRLYQALRHLVLADQLGEEACLIEWSDDKPTGCVPGAPGHACGIEAGHPKRCVCRCGARPAKGSSAAKVAKQQREEMASDEITPEQQAMIKAMFPNHVPPTGKTVNEETAQRFMDLGAAKRMGLDNAPAEATGVGYSDRRRALLEEDSAHPPARSTAPAEAELDRYIEAYGPLGPEDIH